MDENSILLEEVVGTKAKVRILSYMYNFNDFDYSISDVANQCSISWNTAKKELVKLTNIGLLEETRTKGNQTYYKAIQNKIYKSFFEFENQVTDLLRSKEKST
jgi:Fic family protein